MAENSIQDHFRKLLPNVFGGGTAAARISHARTVAEAYADVRDSVEAARRYGRVSFLDYVRADRGDKAAAERVANGVTRTVAMTTLADLGGVLPQQVLLGDGETGLDFGVPMIRVHSLDVSNVPGDTPVLPSVVTGSPFGLVNPSVPIDDGAGTVTIGDVGEAWSIGVCYSDAAIQIRRWIEPAAEPMLDAELLAIADRGAERGMVQTLEAEAGGTRSGAADLGAALDEAEAEAGTLAGQTLMIVSPVDWPAVRRSVAQSWNDHLPHPTVALSVGATTGTVTLVGQSAAHLFVKEAYVDAAKNPQTLREEMTVARPFLAAVRDADRIQTVTGL